MAVTAGLSLLMLMALPVAAQNHLIYFEIGKSVKLDPKYHEVITAITWKHNEDIIAEYIKGKVDLINRGDYKGRAHVDVTTGTLTISNTKKSDDGEFTVEVNDMILPVRFNVVGVRKLDDYPVEITARPQRCSSLTSRNCTLICGEQFEDAEPVQYFWKKGKTGQWKEGKKTISISVTKNTPSISHYTCKVKNLFSEKESDPIAIPFKTEPSSGPVPLPAILLVAVLAIGAAVIL